MAPWHSVLLKHPGGVCAAAGVGGWFAGLFGDPGSGTARRPARFPCGSFCGCTRDLARAAPDAARSPRGRGGSTTPATRRRRSCFRGRSGRRRSRSCRGPASPLRRVPGPPEGQRPTRRPGRGGSPRGFRSRKPSSSRRRGLRRGIPCRGCFRCWRCSPAWRTSRAGRRREPPPNPAGCSCRRRNCRSRIRRSLRRRPGGSVTAWNAEGPGMTGMNGWGPPCLLLSYRWHCPRFTSFLFPLAPSVNDINIFFLHHTGQDLFLLEILVGIEVGIATGTISSLSLFAGGGGRTLTSLRTRDVGAAQ